MEQHFEVGDRVIAIDTYDGNKSIVGKVGTIMGRAGELYDVNFDEEIEYGHICRNNCDDKHGWHIHFDYLIIVPSAPIDTSSLPISYMEIMQ